MRMIDMEWNLVERNWKEVKGKVKEFGKLTDGDMDSPRIRLVKMSILGFPQK
jgi:hypothetical protein